MLHYIIIGAVALLIIKWIDASVASVIRRSTKREAAKRQNERAKVHNALVDQWNQRETERLRGYAEQAAAKARAGEQQWRINHGA